MGKPSLEDALARRIQKTSAGVFPSVLTVALAPAMSTPRATVGLCPLLPGRQMGCRGRARVLSGAGSLAAGRTQQ